MVASFSLNLRRILFCMILTLLHFFLLQTSAVHSTELLLGTGDRGSFSHFAGKWLCHTLNVKNDRNSCQVFPNNDPTTSLVNVNNGALDMALVNSKLIHDAQVKKGAFRYIDIDLEELRLLLPFYRIPVSLVARGKSDIDQVADLVNRRINIGAPLSLEAEVFRQLMEIMGWSDKSFSTLERLSSVNGQDLIAFNSGSVQVMMHLGMHPDPRIGRLLDHHSGKIVGITGSRIDQLIDSKVGFCLGEIQQGAYDEMDGPIDTLAMEIVLATSADTDNETVSWLLSAILDDRRKLRQAHPAFMDMKIDIETLNDSYLHPHPEAILFFQENIHRLSER